MKYLTSILFIAAFISFNAQAMQEESGNDTSNDTIKNSLPYFEIPENPSNFSGGSILSRVIDGLGYRYFWASEGLREEDLAYKPSDDAASMLETVEHVHGLSVTILNAAKNLPNIRPYEELKLTYEEYRGQSLLNLKEASDLFRTLTEGQLDSLKVTFQRSEKSSEFPLWNLINGQIADAIYHTGQMVSFRRTTGNPMSPVVNVFMGKNREAKK